MSRAAVLPSIRREGDPWASVAGLTAEMQLNMVLLPAPFGPISAITGPPWFRLMLLLATRPPKRLVTVARFEQQRAAGRRLAARQQLGLRHLAATAAPAAGGG